MRVDGRQALALGMFLLGLQRDTAGKFIPLGTRFTPHIYHYVPNVLTPGRFVLSNILL